MKAHDDKVFNTIPQTVSICTRPHLVVDDSCHRRPHRHGEREESQQGADGLTGSCRAAQVEGDGTDQGDEAAVEESHEAADDEEDLVLVVPGTASRRDQHRAHAKAEEGELEEN